MAWCRSRRSPVYRLCGALLLLAIISLWAFTPRAARQPNGHHGPPRLLVLVVFDQMRGDYLGRWSELFEEGGFRRLMHGGAWFRNCHYPYADTTTGPGHASLATGLVPAEHGIVANEWFDRRRGKNTYCVEDDRYSRVPPAPPDAAMAPTSKKKKTVEGAVSPENLLVPTFGDLLKDATGGRSKVIAVSFKDRSAALLGGRHADGCYWIDTATGDVITSTYYRDRLPAWATEYNRSRVIDRWQGENWTPLSTPVADAPGSPRPESFSYPLAPVEGRRWKSYWEALYYTAIGNEVVLDLAQRAVRAERLGQHDVTDLLVVSFSSNDTVGHEFGPDSPEVLDVTLRADDIMRRLLETLDRQVGPGQYLLALSADHGVCPLPEVLRARGETSARIPLKLLSTHAEDFLRATFGQPGEKAQWVEASADPWIYLNQALLKHRGLEPAKVERALADWLEQQPGILQAFTRTELLAGPPADRIGLAMWKSFHPDRAGDVGVVLKPYFLFDTYLTGTTHGTPHPYDTHVPLILYGPGMPAQVFDEPVVPQAIAAIFAHHAGTAAPRGLHAVVPQSLR